MEHVMTSVIRLHATGMEMIAMAFLHLKVGQISDLHFINLLTLLTSYSQEISELVELQIHQIHQMSQKYKSFDLNEGYG